MKKKAITDKLSDKNMLDDLQALLNEELAKPLEERDLDAIEKITCAMVDINDKEIPQPVSAEEVLAEVAARKKRHRIVLLRKWAATLSACFALCVALNFYTLRTYGSNVFEAMINMAKSGFSIDTNQLRDLEPAAPPEGMTTTTTTAPAGVYTTQVTGAMATTAATYTTGAIATTTAAFETTTAPVSAKTPMEDMLNKCDTSARAMAEEILTRSESAGVYPCYPTQLPDALSDPECTDFHNEKLKDSNDCYFTFENGSVKLDINIEAYYSEELMPNVLVPSDNDSYDIFKGREISGFIMGDDNSCTAVFVYENTVYTLHGSGVSYNELEVIAESFIPYPSEFIKK